MPLQEASVRSDINVTPLVDVVLVLLIIFMVVTPMLGSENVLLPATEHPRKNEPEQSKTIILTLDHSFLWEEQHVSAAQLESLLDDLYQRTPSTGILLQADRRLPYGEVYSALEMISRKGFHKVALVSQQKTD